jgi:hypothetical protein
MLLIALMISLSFIKSNQNLERNNTKGLSDEEKKELKQIVTEE